MRKLKLPRDGTSLVELLFIIVIVVIVIVSLSLVFSQASANAVLTRQRMVANNLANAQLQMLKNQSYDFIDTSDQSAGIFNTNCDCRTVDFTLPFLSSATFQMAGTTFLTVSCVHYVDKAAAWGSACGPGDTGYKNVVVHTQWENRGHTHSTLQQSLAIR